MCVTFITECDIKIITNLNMLPNHQSSTFFSFTSIVKIWQLKYVTDYYTNIFVKIRT